MKLEAVVFDMDGLMIDSERIVQMTWNIAGERMGYGKLGEHIYHTLGFQVKKREVYFKSVYGEEFPFEEFRKETKKEWNAYVKQHSIPAKEGLYDLLEELKKRSIKLGVATSSSRAYALGELKDKGVDGYFDEFVFGDMVKEGKPAPDIYLRACERLQVEPACALALEDSIHGIKAAHAAGMRSIFVPDLVRDATSIQEIIDAELKNLYEVKEWIISHTV